MKRLTHQFVKEQFEKEGYELLSKEYVNAQTKLGYRCTEGHEYGITWNNWQQGYRCPDCAVDARLSIEFVRSEFEKEGYTLLTKKYKNNKQKLEYICPNGHRHSISWVSWNCGSRCRHCDRRRTDINSIKKSFELEGYKLLSDDYINAKTELKYKCPNGHISSIRWDNWNNLGQRCKLCADIEHSGSGHWNWQGGISCEPYCDIWLDKEFKESILERDNYQCQNPDCWRTSKRLTVHHIDYNKKNCRPENLITLCNSCNSRANFDRRWHKSFYRIVMGKKNKIKKFVTGL